MLHPQQAEAKTPGRSHGWHHQPLGTRATSSTTSLAVAKLTWIGNMVGGIINYAM
jgi:hypothetical protein